MLNFLKKMIFANTESESLREKELLEMINYFKKFMPVYMDPGITDRNQVGLKILHDEIDRPAYAYSMWLAAIQAAKLGIKKVHCIEFGVAYGYGLINMCNISKIITESTDIEFCVTGFDSDCGMPELIDYRDHPEIWVQGQFLSEHDKIRQSLTTNAKLISGNIKNTIDNFLNDITEDCPLGFVSIDVDLYSSTIDCFEIFSLENPRFYLPTTIVHFDDINDQLTNNNYTGEELAIREFNANNDKRKLQELRVRQNHFPRGWHDHIYGLHVLNHPVKTGEISGGLLHNINITAL